MTQATGQDTKNERFSNLVVIGAGAWGSTLAMLANQNKCRVGIISQDKARAEALAQSRGVPNFPQHKIPKEIQITDQLENLDFKPQVMLLVTPVQRSLAILKRLPHDIALVCCNKGLDLRLVKTPYEMALTMWQEEDLAVLSGPNFAIEILEGKPAASVIASKNSALASRLAHTLTSSRFRPYTSGDPLGVSLCAAVKNCLALAAGICKGAKLGENTRAALVTRAMRELRLWLPLAGANPDTLYGLSGLGDILLSCSSHMSRNFAYGEALGSNNKPPAALAEGVDTLSAVCDSLRKESLAEDAPLLMAVEAVIKGKLGIDEAIDLLFARKLTVETHK